MHVYGVCFNCKKGSQGILLEMIIFEPRQEPFYSIHIKEAIELTTLIIIQYTQPAENVSGKQT